MQHILHSVITIHPKLHKGTQSWFLNPYLLLTQVSLLCPVVGSSLLHSTSLKSFGLIGKCISVKVTKVFLNRSNASSNSAQNQLQGFRDSLARLTSERDKVKKDLENSNSEMQEKNKTITQVKKIGRRYKSQYEELKAQHDKVGLRQITSGFLGMHHIYWADKTSTAIAKTLHLFFNVYYTYLFLTLFFLDKITGIV